MSEWSQKFCTTKGVSFFANEATGELQWARPPPRKLEFVAGPVQAVKPGQLLKVSVLLPLWQTAHKHAHMRARERVRSGRFKDPPRLTSIMVRIVPREICSAISAVIYRISPRF